MFIRNPLLVLVLMICASLAFGHDRSQGDLENKPQEITLPPDVLRGAFDLLNEGNPAYRALDLEPDALKELAADLRLARSQRVAFDAVLLRFREMRRDFVDVLAQSLMLEYAEKQRPGATLDSLEAVYSERDYLRASLAEARAAYFQELLDLLDPDQRQLLLPQHSQDGEPAYQPTAQQAADKMANWCTAHIMIIGSDSRYARDTCTKWTAPWQNVGRLNIGCSATLIGDRFVLTAAHCLIDGNGNFFDHTVIYFKLGQYNSDTTDYQTPFGTYYVKRAIVPAEYATTNNEEDRSFEYALLELAEPIPGATPMAFDYLDWTTTSAKTAYTVGYPGGSTGVFANNPLVGGGGSPLQDSAYRWLNGGDSGLLVHSLDAEGGQSGSAIYVIQNNVRILIGVMVGSPISECQAGRVWGSRITTGAESRIRGWMANYWDNTWSAKRKSYLVLNPYAANAPGCWLIGNKQAEEGPDEDPSATKDEIGFK